MWRVAADVPKPGDGVELLLSMLEVLNWIPAPPTHQALTAGWVSQVGRQRPVESGGREEGERG